jgi:TonB-linked SusC/RagA family outer membrane protein
MIQFSYAQEKTVTGVVSEKTGPLPGANVVVKGTTRGTQTDVDGKYSIKAKVGETLVISFISMKDVYVKVGASNTVNVKLEQDKVDLSEVVVLGYDRKSTKAKSAAATTTVTAETFKNRPNSTLLQSLQGAAPGLNVSTSSGSPGSSRIDLLVRGIGTLSGATDPLYVIDGIATNSVVFRNINPEDIESATILRDAIATSIYGNRGANGVIVIKTKSGKFDSKMKVSFSSSSSFAYLPKDNYNLANSQQALQIERAYGVGAGAGLNPSILGGSGVPMTDAEIASFSSTDWRKEYFRMSLANNYNLSFSSGSKSLTNFTSLSYLNQGGIVPGTDFQRFTFRTNFSGKNSDEKFTYGTNFTAAFSKRHQLDQETSTSIYNNVVQNPLLGSLTALPYYNSSMYPGSGQALYDMIGTDFTNGNTTFVLQDILRPGNVPNQINEVKVLGNANATYKFTDAFSFSTKIGVDYTVADRIFARAPWSYLAIAVRESNGLPYGGFESQSTDRDFGFNTVSSFNYTKTINKHVFDFGVYSEYIKAQRNFDGFRQNGLDLKTYAFGAGTGWTNVGANYSSLRPTVSAFQALAGSFSYFATAGYEYDGKFGLDAIVRRDASYRFIDNNKWGTFWSLGGRWNIDKERFMENAGFSMLKLRASYGTQGNQNILAAAYGQNPLYTANNLVRDLVASGTGYGNSGAYGLDQLGNSTLQWEVQTMANIGFDFETLKGRLTGNVDVYDKKTDKLFNEINLSAIVGNGPTMNGNNGGLDNRGIELSLRYKVIKNFKGLNLDVYANGSYNKNKITNIERTVLGDRINEVGSKVYEFFEVPYVGVNPANGNLQFLDINNNITEAPRDSDRRRTGKSSTPDYQGAFGLNVDYKGFFLDSQFSWVTNVWRYDSALAWLLNPNYAGDNNISADLLNAWTPTNTITNVPSLTATNFASGGKYSDMWLKNASYLRLKNISLGYNFDKRTLEKSFFKAVKLYVQGENLHTWTKWRGFDADSGEETSLGRFPTPRTYSFGINVEF